MDEKGKGKVPEEGDGSRPSQRWPDEGPSRRRTGDGERSLYDFVLAAGGMPGNGMQTVVWGMDPSQTIAGGVGGLAADGFNVAGPGDSAIGFPAWHLQVIRQQRPIPSGAMGVSPQQTMHAGSLGMCPPPQLPVGGMGMWALQQTPAAFESAQSAAHQIHFTPHYFQALVPAGPVLPAWPAEPWLELSNEQMLARNAQQIGGSSSSVPPPGEGTATLTSNSIIDVWADTSSEAFAYIERLLKRDSKAKFMVGFDSEFAVPDGVKSSPREPASADLHYTQLCSAANGGDLIQVGFAIADDEFNVHGAWQFNLYFDPSWRLPGHEGIDFLRGVGFNLEEHARRGIPVANFVHWLWSSGAIANGSLTWVTFMGYPDFGLLVRLLMGKELPESRKEFLTWFWQLFPRSYDVRVFSKLGKGRKEIIHGGLAKVCEKLKAGAIGKAHHAGSDALTALLCLAKMVNQDPEFAELMSRFCAVLYGVDTCQ